LTSLYSDPQLPGLCWACKWALNKVKKIAGKNATAEVKCPIRLSTLNHIRKQEHLGRSSSVIFTFAESEIKPVKRLQ